MSVFAFDEVNNAMNFEHAFSYSVFFFDFVFLALPSILLSTSTELPHPDSVGVRRKYVSPIVLEDVLSL